MYIFCSPILISDRDFLFYESNFLLADADETHDHRTQHHVEEELKDKIRADKANDHILADVCTKAHRIRPAADGLHKEEQAADQEHAGIDHRTDHCGHRHGKRAVLVLKRLVDKAGEKARQRALDEHRQDRAKRVDAEERRRVAAEQHDHAEHKAEPRASTCAVERRTDNDRHQHQRNAERAKPDKAAHQLQNDHNSGEQTETNDLLRVVVLTHMFLLSPGRPCKGGYTGVTAGARRGKSSSSQRTLFFCRNWTSDVPRYNTKQR